MGTISLERSWQNPAVPSPLGTHRLHKIGLNMYMSSLGDYQLPIDKDDR